MAAFFVPLNSSEPGTLTKEEQDLVGKGAIMQMYKPDEHTRHFIAHIDSAKNPANRKNPKDSQGFAEDRVFRFRD
jgi:hypothetical protein